MFGTLGVPEMAVIFILALLLFGPKKLPELGRTVGKAITEFRRASNELKSTFEREMKAIEQETESLKDITKEYQYDTYNYDYSSYENTYETSSGAETHDSTTATSPTISASAPQGAESPAAALPEGTIAHGTEPAAIAEGNGHSHDAPASNGEATEHSPVTAEHKNA